MRNDRHYTRRVASLMGVCIGLAVLLVGATGAPAFQFGGLSGQDQGLGFGGKQSALGQGDRVPKMVAGITKPAADGTAQLFIVATMPEGAHTYSITQPEGATIRTKIKVEPTAEVLKIGKFHTVGKPQVKHDEADFPGIPLEEQSGKVKWFAPVKIAAGTKLDAIKLQGKVYMQLCEERGVCAMPADYAFTAKYRPDVAAEKEPVETPAKNNTKAPSTAKGTGAGANSSPAPSTNSTSVAPPPSISVEVPQQAGEINWLPFTSAADLRTIVNPETFDIDQVRENVRQQDTGASSPIVASWGFLGSVIMNVLRGFLGGLILNVMPCVLPVMGLKILSFVQQSGHKRGRAFMLNLCYSAGLLSVFMLLALLAVVIHLGWGELLGRTWFKITFAIVLFGAALMFMGVWEAPLPAFLGGGTAGKLAAQEGATGAFFKGVLTTFLATPCTAPFLAPALVWAAAQPPWLTYVVFASIGLGMASPYLLIGAFPELVRFLPKPGGWMETFKQFMGFVLMGTVVYLLAVLKPQYVVPTTGLLLGIALACWMVGRIGPEQEFGAKLRTWALAMTIVGVAWILMFPGLDERVLGPYHFPGLVAVMDSRDAPADTANPSAPRVSGPHTVLVDFTASWCQNCHLFERLVLRTSPVIESLREHGVVALKADWSDADPKVTEMLDVLGSRQVPVIAIFPARDPNHPIIFRGSYTQQAILDALQKAAEPARVVASS